MSIFNNINYWLLFGLGAQFVFFMRFFVQWIYSEKKKKSSIPLAFWYLSIVGSILIFIYAIHIKDPVFMLGQSLALLIYVRNIFLFKKDNDVTQ